MTRCRCCLTFAGASIFGLSLVAESIILWPAISTTTFFDFLRHRIQNSWCHAVYNTIQSLHVTSISPRYASTGNCSVCTPSHRVGGGSAMPKTRHVSGCPEYVIFSWMRQPLPILSLRHLLDRSMAHAALLDKPSRTVHARFEARTAQHFCQSIGNA